MGRRSASLRPTDRLAAPPSVQPTSRSSATGPTIRARLSGGSGSGSGSIKEIGWGLRPQLAVDLSRQVGDAPLAPFGKQRRDWLLQGSLSIYKRDWNIGGFAPSLSVTVTRNHSTLTLYKEKRLRGEVRLTKAF